MEEKEVQKGFIEGNISLIINSYADIFSSFDSRGFSEKALSDDFLLECKKATIDKADTGLELIIAVPRAKRIFSEEAKIKKRLKEHFRKHFLGKEREMAETKKAGWMRIIIGMILMFFSYLLYSDIIPLSELVKNFFLVITEPAGWFFFWIGGEKLVYESKDQEPDFNFYKKMADCQITFRSY